jgi:ATP-dependent Clp protease ATP-binding subunit ClpA
MWQSLVVDLAEEVRNQPPRRIIGRHEEVERGIVLSGVDRKICGSFYDNPVLVGPKAAGKSAVISEVIRQIVDGQSSNQNKFCHLFRCREAGLADYDTFRQLLDSLNKLPGQVVLYLQDMPRLAEAYWPLLAGKKADQFNFLTKTIEMRGGLTIITELRPEQYAQLIDSDDWTRRRYYPILLPDLSAKTALRILRARSQELEANPSTAGVRIPDAVLRKLVDRVGEALPEMLLPGVLLDLYKAIRDVAERKGCPEATEHDIELALAERPSHKG